MPSAVIGLGISTNTRLRDSAGSVAFRGKRAALFQGGRPRGYRLAVSQQSRIETTAAYNGESGATIPPGENLGCGQPSAYRPRVC